MIIDYNIIIALIIKCIFICRTQSNNVQIIKIIPSGGTLDSCHRNITKVTLGSSEEAGERRRHSAMSNSSQQNVNNSSNVENEKKLEKMKTSILRMMETKDLATQENTTLRRYKSSVEKLKQENKRLKTEIESLNKRAEVKCEEDRRPSPDGKESTGAPAENDLAGKVTIISVSSFSFLVLITLLPSRSQSMREK